MDGSEPAVRTAVASNSLGTVETALPTGELTAIAAEINKEQLAVNQVVEAGLEHARRAGELLLRVKGTVGRGQWLPWLRANFHGSVRTAQAYMQVSDRYVELLSTPANAQRVAHFALREALRMIAEPESIIKGDADHAPLAPASPLSRVGDLWLCGDHRVLCGDATRPDDVARLLGERQPILLVTDPPYGVELDSEWRDRAGWNGCGRAEAPYIKHRTAGHTETAISGDTRADWSEAFERVPILHVAYVWHASKFTNEVLNGLLRIGFLYPQQIIWNKTRPVLTHSHYWFQHEPCWYVRKKNAPWFGVAGAENTSIWEAASPKFMIGGSKDLGDDKQDHPTQKPVELMRRPILNHTHRGATVYDPFLGSGTTLITAELTGRKCCGIEIAPKYVDVIVRRWQELTGRRAIRDGDGRTLDQIAREGRQAAA